VVLYPDQVERGDQLARIVQPFHKLEDLMALTDY
jgi:hypothetical protein